MKKMKIAVLGTQASGKGTQSHILSVLMGVPAVSVGDLLRDLQNEDSDRGRMAKSQMAKGSFVPDDVTFPLIKEWAAKNARGWIVDGFPRSVEQAEKTQSFFKPDFVVYLEVPDEESKRRISYRRICPKCKTNYNLITQPPKNQAGICDIDGGELVSRADDTPELVAERLKHYHEVTEPLKDWYAKRKKLLLVDAKGTIPDVARAIQLRIEEFQRSTRHRFKFRVWLLVAFLLLLGISILFTVTGYFLNNP